MQKIVILIILAIFLVSGSALTLQFKKQFSRSSNGTQPNIAMAPEAEPSSTAESVQQEKIAPTPSSKVKPTTRPTLQPTKTQSANLQQYVYPGSTITNQTQTSLSLVSSDDTMQIVQWYKKALAREDAQINNTVVNTVNGNTTATLTVSTNGQNMYVTITHSDSTTSIRLEQK